MNEYFRFYLELVSKNHLTKKQEGQDFETVVQCNTS